MRTIACMFALIVLALAPGARASGLAIDAAADARLRSGAVLAEIVDEPGPGGRLQAAIDIPAPLETVWDLMLDCDRAPRYVPGLEACAVLEADPEGRFDVREHKIRWLAILPRLTLRFRSDYTPMREIRFSRTGGDLALMVGVWRLEPLAEGAAVRVHYDVRMAPARFLPSGLVESGLKRDAPKVLEALRAQALAP